MVYYPIDMQNGLNDVISLNDGYTINLQWFTALPSTTTNRVGYNIYYSTIKENVFTDGVKYISIDNSTEANIINLTPGQTYFFSVRPFEYDPELYDLTNILPIVYDNLRFYPFSSLRQNITESDLTIPLFDVESFPPTGIIKVGVELIQYSFIDYSTNDLLLADGYGRGYGNTDATIHMTDGYDGYVYWNPEVIYFLTGEEQIYDHIYICQARFEYPNFQYTVDDGYHQITKDILTSDLSVSDEYNVDFPSYDYAGYHRTDPVQLINGTCVGSYIGGEVGCIDKYGNVNLLRGFTLQDSNLQRQELGLSVTGKPAVLIQRERTGITCSCYQPSSEYPDDRCPICLGSKFVVGWKQYFNPRRADGRIMVRSGPTDEKLKMIDAGLESEFILDFWTLTVPTIKDRDIVVLFDQDDNEEFRYEVLSVTRNNTVTGLQGGQKFKGQRIRKTDPAYQIRVFRNTEHYPVKYNTTIAISAGILPHTHEIVGNENNSSSWSQLTSVSQGHNHVVVYKNGVLTVNMALGHTHQIVGI